MAIDGVELDDGRGAVRSGQIEYGAQDDRDESAACCRIVEECPDPIPYRVSDAGMRGGRSVWVIGGPDIETGDVVARARP